MRATRDAKSLAEIAQVALRACSLGGAIEGGVRRGGESEKGGIDVAEAAGPSVPFRHNSRASWQPRVARGIHNRTRAPCFLTDSDRRVSVNRRRIQIDSCPTNCPIVSRAFVLLGFVKSKVSPLIRQDG